MHSRMCSMPQIQAMVRSNPSPKPECVKVLDLNGHLMEMNELLSANPDPTWSKRMNALLGICYLRQGETENCCLRSNSQSCILPIQGGGVHSQPEGSRKAIKYYIRFLEQSDSKKPEDFEMHFGAIWLLNVAYMTLNEYPDRVPEKYRIPPELQHES